MVLTKSELIASLQNEVRILLHLAGKVDGSNLDYRPTPKQRSTLELLRYLGIMGPELVKYALAETPSFDDWTKAEQASATRNLDEAIATIAGQAEHYKTLLAGVSDATFRSEMTDFDGSKTTRGSFIVNLVICGSAAYRTQLFLYLKASGQEALGTMNLWGGSDAKE